MSRAAVAILSTENLIHNLGVIRQNAPNSQVIAMVKANAYGHGIRSTSLRLDPHVDTLGVASIDEALVLRKAGIKKPITLMEGVFFEEEYLSASCENFHVVVHSLCQVQWLLKAKIPLPLKIWLKVDTGMGRLGFWPQEVPEMLDRLKGSKNINHPIGLMSHFAVAEIKDHPKNKEQIHSFEVLASLFPQRSLCNSAAIFNFSNHLYEFVRPGLALYGISPLPHISAEALGLRPVATLRTRLISVRTYPKGASIGYGGRYLCPEQMPVGVIAMGYGDGYPRTARDGTPILVNGKRCQLVGRTSMDMTTIDLKNCPNAQIGDDVLLWGEGLPLEEVALHTESVPYDILCGLQSRVKFQWTSMP